ncbi:acyltransferase [Frankia sp. AgPm24]|uniref:acyltransferase n=1 Tax=Frankia sp. AgPm24 TaxID=631128 RepID=UPI002010135D|nr:acyltransferase [Frankia sp. AgPm24]MCK9925023.1 acyltransferase [Frankia sp. AgPm24]
MKVRRLCYQVWLELGILAQGFIVNVLGGSVLTPRPIRYLLYRLGGVKTQSAEIFPRCVLGHRAHLGRHVGLGWGVFIDNSAEVHIGDHTIVGPQATFLTSGHPIGPMGVQREVFEKGPIRVGAHSWVGARAVVMPGVTIGDHTVVAGGSVVTRDCEDFGLYAGVPAKKIRSLQASPVQENVPAQATVKTNTVVGTVSTTDALQEATPA